MGKWTPTAERFWSKVDKQGHDKQGNKQGCWLWTGAPNKQGRGSFLLDGRTQSAARAAATLGGVPFGSWQCITQTCGNKLCMRPDHLEAVTKAELARRIVQAREARHIKLGRVRVKRSVAGARTPCGNPRRETVWLSAAKADAHRKRLAPRVWLCEVCGGGALSGRKYCSRDCWDKGLGKKLPVKGPTACKRCGLPTPRGPRGGYRSKFCGKVCLNAFKADHARSQRQPKYMYIRVCHICGNNYVRVNYVEAKTCGKACAAKLSDRKRKQLCYVCKKALSAPGDVRAHACQGACRLTAKQRRKKKKVRL